MTGRFKTHVCLVSNEAAANLLPVLDPDFRPREVVLVESPQMRKQGQWLEKVMIANGLARIRHLPVKDAFDIPGIELELDKFLEGESEPAAMALNVTGGTKPLAIAAQQAFGRHRIAVFYLQRERSEVSFIGGDGTKQVLKARLKLEDYFRAHGHEVSLLDRTAPAQADLDLARELVKEIGSLGAAIPRLNWCGSRAEGRADLCSDPLEPRDRNAHFERLVALIERAGKASWKADRLCFSSEPARAFATGGWFELYVHDEFLALQRRGIGGDGARNLHIVQPNGTKNEFDLAFFARNRLHLVECKTRGFTGSEAEQEARKALYQLDSLTALGGLNTRAMFVSYRALDSATLQRAKDLRIRTVVGNDLGQLASELEKWTAQAF